MSDTKSQVDYILIKKKWILNSMKDISAYNLYASFGSDHPVLWA